MKTEFRNKIIIFVLLTFVILGVSMAYADENKEILKIADPIVDKLTKGMETKNYDMYIKQWSPEAKKMIKKDKFEANCDATIAKVGKLKSKTFYNIVDQKGYKIVQWKAKFTKAPQDVYLQLMLKKIDKKYYVEGHWIRPEPLK